MCNLIDLKRSLKLYFISVSGKIFWLLLRYNLAMTFYEFYRRKYFIMKLKNEKNSIF